MGRIVRIRELSPFVLSLLVGSGTALLFCWLHLAGLLQPVENIAYDFRFRSTARPELASDRVAIIALDDGSFESEEMLENFGRWPWKRNLYAQLLWYLRQAPAAAVGIDIMFAGRDASPEADALLAGQLAEKADTVLPLGFLQLVVTRADGTRQPPRAELARHAWQVEDAGCGPSEEYTSVSVPLADLHEKARALGGITVRKDDDGVLRRSPLFYRYGGRYYPSLALALAAPSLKLAPAGTGSITKRPAAAFDCDGGLRLGTARLHADAPWAVTPIYWYGGARTFRHYPVWEIFNSALALYNGQKPAIAPSEFKDKIVLIGPTAIGIGDVHATPFAAVYPGVEVNATLLSNLIEGHTVRPAGRGWSLALITLMAMAAAWSVWAFTDWRVYTALTVLVASLFVVANLVLFREARISLVIVAPLAAAAVAYTTGNLARYIIEGREKKRYRATLVRYVAPSLVDAIMKDPRLADLHSEKREMSVLFSDVRGFTSISEKIPVDQLIATLNEFLDGMVEVIFRNGGTLDKFVGDCVMAFWNAPVRQDNHAELAARAALEMHAALERLNDRWRAAGRPELKIGVGINTGDMIFGNIGSQQRMDLTVIGDNVNLASRLESSTKELGAHIVISEATYRQIEHLAEVRELGTIKVKGKEKGIHVYELLGMSKKGSETYASTSTTHS